MRMEKGINENEKEEAKQVRGLYAEKVKKYMDETQTTKEITELFKMKTGIKYDMEAKNTNQRDKINLNEKSYMNMN